MKQTILVSWQQNRTPSIIVNQMEIMMQEMKLSVIQNYQNLIFVITVIVAF